MPDPNTDVTGGGADFLKTHGIEVAIGVCEDRAQKLNEIFIKYSRTKRPFVFVKCAATLDGRIATRTGDSKWITNEKSRRFVHRLRSAVDAIMVGINTVRRDDPRLTTRLQDRPGKDPVRIILDTHLTISPDARVLRQKSNAETILVTGSTVSGDKKSALERAGAHVIDLPLKEGRIDLTHLMKQLGSMQITSLLIEGGSQVIASAFRAGIVDKAYFFYAPKILGGDDGVPICKGPGPDLMRRAIPLKDIRVQLFDNDVLIEGYVA
jgi:diaminohydroxyphosphoribosylaminopyrimidine deaminase/5-amino-6-(5-phosphoribosylamino)uracil reductase